MSGRFGSNPALDPWKTERAGHIQSHLGFTGGGGSRQSASPRRATTSESLVSRLGDSQAWAKLVREAPAFLKSIENLPLEAKSGAFILITDEIGTGKELAARGVHYMSESGVPVRTP